MKKAIIFDIDGTLANIDHRAHFVEGSNPDWDRFYESMYRDDPIESGVMILQALDQYIKQHDLSIEIFLFTGRPERYREITQKWFRDNTNIDSSIYFSNLWMRPNDNFDPDVELKMDWYEILSDNGYDFVMVFDDRKSVVDAWRDIGIQCYQCDKEEF